MRYLPTSTIFMSIEELESAYNDRVAVLEKYPDLKGLEIENSVVLVMPVPKYFRRSSRAWPKKIKSPFGLVRWYPGNSGLIIYPSLTQVNEYLQNAKKFIEVDAAKK